MADVRPNAFDTATIGDDDTTLTIVFWSGVEPCSVLDHVDVSYGADAVTVTLFQGYDPNAGQVACIEIAVQKQVTITLDEPLAGRTIVDGAALGSRLAGPDLPGRHRPEPESLVDPEAKVGRVQHREVGLALRDQRAAAR